MHDFETDTICIHKDEITIRRNQFSVSSTEISNNTLSLYVETDTYETINTFTDDNPIVYHILNKLLETGPINVTDNRENAGLNFISTIPRGTIFKLHSVKTNDYMPYPISTDNLNLKKGAVHNITTPRIDDVLVAIRNKEGNAFTDESRKFTQMLNSELIYWQTEGQFGKFNKRNIVYAILPSAITAYNQYGAGYQTGGMWQCGGFFMVC